MISELYTRYDFLIEDETCKEGDREYYHRINPQMDDVDASMSVHYLAKLMYQYDWFKRTQKDYKKDAFILEFKVRDHDEEKTMEDTLASAHAQIEEK